MEKVQSCNSLKNLLSRWNTCSYYLPWSITPLSELTVWMMTRETAVAHGLHTAHPVTLTLTLTTLSRSLESVRTLFLSQGSSQSPSLPSPLLAPSACAFFYCVLHNLVIATTLCPCFCAALLPVFTMTTVTLWPEEPMWSHLYFSLTNTVFKFFFSYPYEDTCQNRDNYISKLREKKKWTFYNHLYCKQ